MYHDYYQLKENPFNITSDPDFFFMSKFHSDAILSMEYGVGQRKGILVITGEVGTGKTTLCRRFIKQYADKTKFAFILNPNFTSLQLLQMITQDLGIITPQKDKFGLTKALNEFLIEETKKGFNVVIVIDEAQNLGVDQLEQIRLLSNLETDKEKLLQIILVGQPELDAKLNLPKLRQLRQRVTVHHHLQPLDKNDLRLYIDHRLVKAERHQSPTTKVAFTSNAIDAIYSHSKGSPRTINIICDRALLAGFVSETFSIDENIIENCAKEVLTW